MDAGSLYSIGELARRTGLPVRTIRFCSNCGVLPPTDRTPAGHRRYDLEAVARLGLVRTPRDLAVDLATVVRVLQREISVPQAAAAHDLDASPEQAAGPAGDRQPTANRAVLAPDRRHQRLAHPTAARPVLRLVHPSTTTPPGAMCRCGPGRLALISTIGHPRFTALFPAA
jgi:DNA-binding transcriptional MerR regulator